MNCEKAREYIQRDVDGELAANERAALQVHLTACGECRIVSRQTAAIHGALQRLAAATELPREAGPTISFGRQRAIPWRAGFAAAAVLALCAGAWLASGTLRTTAVKPVQLALKTTPEPRPGVEAPLPDRETRNVATAAAEPKARPTVRVTFDPRSNVIAVPRPTKNPNVTIIWVYPAVKTAQGPKEQSLGPSTPIQRS